MEHEKLPRTLKVAHTAYVAALVPVYWSHYGPANFLWFSDCAVIGMVPALWMESRLLTSMLALSTLAPEIPWNFDYFARLVTGRQFIGLSGYMFDRTKPLWLRALSLFHVWVPGMILWTVRRLHYDPRAFPLQLVAGEAVLAASYALAPPKENVNWVYGPGEKPQRKIPRPLYLAAVLVFFPVCMWWPTHRVLKRVLC